MFDVTMPPPARPHARQAQEILHAAAEAAGGRQTEEEFAAALLVLEEERLRPAGLTLTLSRTDDGWISMLVKHWSGKICTAFEFLPKTRQFRPFSLICQYSREALPAAWGR
jgi:hypothetical protein